MPNLASGDQVPLMKRSLELIELINTFDLVVLNNPTSRPTFADVQGSSWIDIATPRNMNLNCIRNWRIDDRTIDSDDNIMDFELFLDFNISKRRTHDGKPIILSA